MATKRFPTLRTQWLGKQMRKLRFEAGTTLIEAGEYLQRDQATVSRMENGISLARVADIVALLDFYGVDDPAVRTNLEQISRDAWQRGWWDGYSKHAPTWMLDLAWMEQRARRIRSFDPLVFHGILQHPNYIRALISSADPNADQTRLDNWIELRTNRQRVLNRDEPVRFESVVDETVLTRRIGGHDVIARQLRHLLDLSRQSNVSFRVLPLDLTGHPAPDGSFALLDLPEPYPSVGHIDTVAGNLWVEAEQANAVADRYDALEAASLTPDESAARVRELLKELE